MFNKQRESGAPRHVPAPDIHDIWLHLCECVCVCKRNFYFTHTELKFEEGKGGVGEDKVCVRWLFRGAEESLVRRPSFPSFPSPVLLQH